MADERVVAKKLEQIEQYHGELKEKQQSLSHEEFLTDTTEQRAVERMFENAIQACSDLAQHVATHDFDFEGDASKEAIRVLGQEGVIEEETMNTLVAAVGFRNVLAHEYGEVDYDKVVQRGDNSSVLAGDRMRSICPLIAARRLGRKWSRPIGVSRARQLR